MVHNHLMALDSRIRGVDPGRIISNTDLIKNAVFLLTVDHLMVHWTPGSQSQASFPADFSNADLIRYTGLFFVHRG